MRCEGRRYSQGFSLDMSDTLEDDATSAPSGAAKGAAPECAFAGLLDPAAVLGPARLDEPITSLGNRWGGCTSYVAQHCLHARCMPKTRITDSHHGLQSAARVPAARARFSQSSVYVWEGRRAQFTVRIRGARLHPVFVHINTCHLINQHAVVLTHCHGNHRRSQMLSSGGPTAAKAREVRRQGVRERCGVQPRPPPATATSATIDPLSTAAAAADATLGNSAAADAAAGGGAGGDGRKISDDVGPPPTEMQVRGVDLVVEGAALSIPYDEAPMRVYVLCEVWAKAVAQVVGPCVQDIKAAVAAIKRGSGAGRAGGAKHKGINPGKYIEVILECR